MSLYGARIGKAFQIVDDILDGDGYAEFISRTKLRAKARNLIEYAKKPLKGFGGRADGLKGIADYMLERVR